MRRRTPLSPHTLMALCIHPWKQGMGMAGLVAGGTTGARGFTIADLNSQKKRSS